MGSLPIDEIDILVVDEIGKNYSGTGMDPLVIGRWKIWGEREPEKPNITTLIALDLSEPSHGNAGGVGLADIITRRLYNKINFYETNKNAETSTYLQRVQIPIVTETEEEAVALALKVCGQPDPKKIKLVKIANTQDLEKSGYRQLLLTNYTKVTVILQLKNP